MIDKTTINIAITAINEWRNQVLVIRKDTESREFNRDTKLALEQLKELL